MFLDAIHTMRKPICRPASQSFEYHTLPCVMLTCSVYAPLHSAVPAFSTMRTAGGMVLAAEVGYQRPAL